MDDDSSSPRPRLPYRPTSPRPQNFRPREMVPSFEERRTFSEFRPGILGRYCPLALIVTFGFLFLWRASLIAIGNESAADLFGYTFLGLATLTGLIGVIFGILSPPRHFETTWLLTILGNALGPLALIAVIVVNVIKEKELKEQGRLQPPPSVIEYRFQPDKSPYATQETLG